MPRRYRLTRADRLRALTFRLPEGTTEVGRTHCKACAVPVATIRNVSQIVAVINVDGTPHRASCAKTFSQRRGTIRDWAYRDHI